MSRILIGCAILLVLILVAIIIANFIFSRQVELETDQLLSYISVNEKEIINEEDLNEVPEIVKKWLVESKIIGKRSIKIARLKQAGMMRLANDKPWMEYDATQVFTVDQPGFLWKVKVRMNPFLTFLGKDTLIEGKGSMQIKVLGLIPVVNESGDEIDQGTMVRYLAEMIWLPSAALSENISWQPINEVSARGTLTIGDKQVSADFHFNQKGELIEIFADRMMDQNGSYTLEKWHIEIDEHNEWGGFKVPSKARVMWELKDGSYEWLNVEIKDIQYE